MRCADLWPPLVALGAERGAALERALGGEPVDEVQRHLHALAEGADAGAQAALLAARFALAQRSGGAVDELQAQAEQAEQALDAQGQGRAADFVRVERAAVALADKTLLPEASRLLDTIEPRDDTTLAAAVARVRGAVARARADLRGSLLQLERARELAEASGHPREIIRTFNTLGTSYAALGVASLGRDALERARELAEVAGQRQSAAIAAGQLAVLALDAGRPALAAQHLELQRRVSERLGDLHGQARALSLLVEATGAAHELSRARTAADACRSLYSRAPSPWTRLQAALASLYEAELALAAGDELRTDELLRSCAEERASVSPTFRVVRARGALVSLEALVRGHAAAGLEAAIDDAFARLAISPRPTWVERALLLALEATRAAGSSGWLAPLAVRAASLQELRAAASSGALLGLRRASPEAAVTRAMSVGRELVLRARLALGPLGPFAGELIELTTDGSSAALDAVLAASERPERPGELAPGVLVSAQGSLIRVATPDAALASQIAGRLRSIGQVRQASTALRVEADPAAALSIVAC